MIEKKKWKFIDAENTVVFTTWQILNRDNPILYASQDEDDGVWQFIYGNNVCIENSAVVLSLGMITTDSTLEEVFDFLLGWMAK